MTTNETIRQLKCFIKESGMSITDTASALGTSKFTLSRWLNGHNKPSQAYEILIKKMLTYK